MNKKNKQKVIVAMSGGVDSSVSAALLKKQGYEVIGVFMRFWKEPSLKKKDNSIKDVKKIAEILDIPLRIIDVRKKFKKEVVGYFLKEYASGRTPNPCIFCNEHIKFKILFEEMRKIKADYIATGHYALIRKLKAKSLKLKVGEGFQFKLLEAKDKNKDQSYFLYRLKQEQLTKIIFPLGKYKKEEVRKLAKKFNLPNFNKEESQDVCFLRGGETTEFLKKHLTKNKTGEIIDKKGNILGCHQGLPLYTIGQRKGIDIGGTGPYYVSEKDYAKNKLIVTNNKKDLSLFSKEAILGEINWIGSSSKFPVKFLARTRYRNSLVYAIIKPDNMKHKTCNKKYRIEFKESQRAVTAGQSVVFYGKEGEVLGGGIVG